MEDSEDTWLDGSAITGNELTMYAPLHRTRWSALLPYGLHPVCFVLSYAQRCRRSLFMCEATCIMLEQLAPLQRRLEASRQLGFPTLRECATPLCRLRRLLNKLRHGDERGFFAGSCHWTVRRKSAMHLTTARITDDDCNTHGRLGVRTLLTSSVSCGGG